MSNDYTKIATRIAGNERKRQLHPDRVVTKENANYEHDRKAALYQVTVEMDYIDEDNLTEVTESGIVIPKDDMELLREQKAVCHGIIVNKGPLAFKAYEMDDKDEPKVGDRIYFDRYAGTDYKEEGRAYRWINDSDVKQIERSE